MNLPISLRILYLPEIFINDLDKILPRLINLEELHIPDNFSNSIVAYPPNLKKLYFVGTYEHELFNLPASLKYIQLVCYMHYSLKALLNSNVEHVNLYEDKYISIVHNLPKSLKKLSIIETHPELYQIEKMYHNIEIEKLPDYDFREEIISSMRSPISW